MQVRGKPASFAKQKRSKILKSYLVYFVLFLTTGIGSVYVLLNSSSLLHYLAVLLGGSASGFLFYKMRQMNISLSKLNAGISAEELVVKVLKKAKFSFLVNGCVVGKIGDIDHLVLGPVCVVIETKYGKGPVFVRDNVLYVNNKILARDPIKQVKTQASVFSSIYQVPTNAIVCISEGDFRSFTSNGVIFCNAKDLPRILSTIPGNISFDKCLEIVTNLKVN